MSEALNFSSKSIRPYWIPDGVDFDALPRTLQTAIVGVLNPAYVQLVLQARDGLEKSTGLTIVHLLWLEILDQIELEQQRPLAPGDADLRAPRDKSIDRLLRVIGAKSKMSGLLLRVQQQLQKGEEFFPEDWHSIAPPPASPR